MGRYEKWLQRCANATPQAHEAVCQRCVHGEWVRTAAFCSGQGRPRKLTSKEWNSTKPDFCPEYKEREMLTGSAQMDEQVGLLKEQEPMMMDTKIIGTEFGDVEVYCCPLCKIVLDPSFHFCPNCGQAVKWND